ncbi:MAG TPA: diguanylate cyclase [Abditibacteriaceae bacterium]
MKRLPWSLSQQLIACATLLYMVLFIAMLTLHPGRTALEPFLAQYGQAYPDKKAAEAAWDGYRNFYTTFHNSYQILAPFFAFCSSLIYGLSKRHKSTATRIGWFLIAASCLAFAAGQAAWTYLESILDKEVPYPGPPDFGYASAGPLMVIGISFLFGAMPIAGRARHLLDSAIAASGFGILIWYFIASHWIARINTPQKTVEMVLSAAYPLADVASLFGALTLLSATLNNISLRRSALLLAIGISLLGFADSMFSYYNLHDIYETGSWFDWGWSFGWIAIAYAALLPLWHPAPQDNALVSKETPLPSALSLSGGFTQAVSLLMLGRVIAPYVVAAFCFGLVALHDFQTAKPGESVQQNLAVGHLSNQVLMLGAWLIFLVTMRQIFTLLENQILTGQLKAFNATLEQKVSQRTGQISSLLQLAKAVNTTRNFNAVVNEAGKHALHVLQADAVVFWSSGGDVPEMSLPPHTFPESVKQEYPGLIKFLTAHEPVEEAVCVSLQEIAASHPSLKTKVARGTMAPQISPPAPASGINQLSTEKSLDDLKGQCIIAPLMWQSKPIGMIAAIGWDKPFDEDEPDMLESIGVEVGNAMENARLYGAALKAADRDSVTGLLNHRAIHQRLDEEFQRAQHQDRPLSVIMMDLNNFKLFNDTYGHPTGDMVLKRVARALESECRKPSILARYGGDEFIAVLPDTDEPKAMVLAQRLSERMRAEGFQRGTDATTVPISLSFGVANYPKDSSNRFELVTIADRNLYQAKITDSGIMGTTETQRSHRALRTEGSFDVLDAMVTAVDNKDRYTRQHSEDVTEYALWIAEELGYSEGTQRVIRIGGLLHDVGKIGVPEDILRKPGKLSDDEYETMKRHTQLGALIVSGVAGMESIIDIVKSHHERWDGSGYPEGLAGEDIPLLGRLLAVADAFSAMTTDRPYRKGFSWDIAIGEIRKGIGTQFDPEMAKAFLATAAKGRPGSAHHFDTEQSTSGNGEDEKREANDDYQNATGQNLSSSTEQRGTVFKSSMQDDVSQRDEGQWGSVSSGSSFF